MNTEGYRPDVMILPEIVKKASAEQLKKDNWEKVYFWPFEL